MPGLRLNRWLLLLTVALSGPAAAIGKAPRADAGADQVSEEGLRVTLDGSASHDPDGGALGFRWVQVSGPAVELKYRRTARASFVAPAVAEDSTLVFHLTVTDPDGRRGGDDVAVRVDHLVRGLSANVRPRVGTSPPGFTNPGPVLPFGMVNVGPDTEGPINNGGYFSENSTITGFSHVHMSAGVPKGGQIPVLPFTGDLAGGDPFDQGWPNPAPLYASPYDRGSEVAATGYYAATLLRYGVRAEVAATTRAALHRYTYDPSAQPRVLIDLSRDLAGYHPASVRVFPRGLILGHVTTDDNGGYGVYFAARASAPFLARLRDGTPVTASGASGGRLGLVLDFAQTAEPLLLKVGISYVDEAGALRNLSREIPSWDFDGVRAASRDAWDRALARIVVEGGTDLQRQSFYTALYHAEQFPNVLSDVDGRYPGPDRALHQDARPHYSQFSLWDSYRGQNALLAEVQPARYRDMVASLLDFHRQAGYLPRWQQAGLDAGHMSGDPAIPFIGEAWCRGLVTTGLRGELFDAMQSLVDRRDPALEKGYLPVPKPSLADELQGGPREAGTTLEFGIADFALALMAQAGGDATAVPQLAEHSLNYRNLLDPTTGFIRPRLADGSWLSPFAPELGYGFQEGTSWQYSWLAQHDYAGVVERMGGASKVNDKLDEFFGFPATLAPLAMPKLQNQITAFGVAYYGNQYAPGNEHDLEAPYAYLYAGAPWKTQTVARAAASIYTPTIDGLPGNDDLGALSGWLVWTMLGLYPNNPGAPLYVVGSPHFTHALVRRDSGDLIVDAAGASDVNRFVDGLSVDGAVRPQPWLVLPRAATHVELHTSAVPDMGWGAALPPPSLSVDGIEAFGCQAQ